MISLFRKIRQKLLSHLPAGKAGNRITQYLTYALGEIALVMIGILLALQVNIWNEGRKTKKFEQEILFLLDQNLQQDSVLLSEELQKAKLAIEVTALLLNQVTHKTMTTA
jgi:hypothetical protein